MQTTSTRYPFFKFSPKRFSRYNVLIYSSASCRKVNHQPLAHVTDRKRPCDGERPYGDENPLRSVPWPCGPVRGRLWRGGPADRAPSPPGRRRRREPAPENAASGIKAFSLSALEKHCDLGSCPRDVTAKHGPALPRRQPPLPRPLSHGQGTAAWRALASLGLSTTSSPLWP